MDDKKYSINLMWIDRDCNQNPSTYAYVLIRVYQWAWIHKGVSINLWIDNVMTSIHNIDALRNPVGFNVIDIRSLPLVKKYAELFTSKISVYFRADLLRIAATINYLENRQDDYFVYSDIDVEPMDKDELFDKITLNTLENSGIVLAAYEETVFENSFHIVANKPNVLKAINTFIIELNVARAFNALKGKLIDRDRPDKSSMQSLSESVFLSYIPMLRYLGILNGDIQITHNNKDAYNHLTFDVSVESFETLFKYTGKLSIPTKIVDMPPPMCHYDYELSDEQSPWSWYTKLLTVCCF